MVAEMENAEQQLERQKLAAEQEELHREACWAELLMDNVDLFMGQKGSFTDLRSLAEQGLQDIISVASAEDRQDLAQRLDALVDAGVPKVLRPIAWKAFLDTKVRRQPGYYSALVHRALGHLANCEQLSQDQIRDHAAGHLQQEEVDAAAAAAAAAEAQHHTHSATTMPSTSTQAPAVPGNFVTGHPHDRAISDEAMSEGSSLVQPVGAASSCSQPVEPPAGEGPAKAGTGSACVDAVSSKHPPHPTSMPPSQQGWGLATSQAAGLTGPAGSTRSDPPALPSASPHEAAALPSSQQTHARQSAAATAPPLPQTHTGMSQLSVAAPMQHAGQLSAAPAQHAGTHQLSAAAPAALPPPTASPKQHSAAGNGQPPEGPPALPPPLSPQSLQACSVLRKTLLQIEKDLPRTLASQPCMQQGGEGRVALRRVLAAFALHNPGVGYTQGMNFVAAVLLMHAPSEEEAFYCLVSVVEDVLPAYYAQDMSATQVDQLMFGSLLRRELPTLGRHLQALGADVASCVFVQWFLCLFVNCLPLDGCLRVWDIAFRHRSVAPFFQVALALFATYGPALLVAKDMLDAFQVVQAMAPLTQDMGHLVHIARSQFVHVDDDLLEELREEVWPEVARNMAERAQLIEGVKQQPRHGSNLWQSMTSSSSSSSTGGGHAAEGGKVSVVKKLLARLDKVRSSASGSEPAPITPSAAAASAALPAADADGSAHHPPLAHQRSCAAAPHRSHAATQQHDRHPQHEQRACKPAAQQRGSTEDSCTTATGSPKLWASWPTAGVPSADVPSAGAPSVSSTGATPPPSAAASAAAGATDHMGSTPAPLPAASPKGAGRAELVSEVTTHSEHRRNPSLSAHASQTSAAAAAAAAPAPSTATPATVPAAAGAAARSAGGDGLARSSPLPTAAAAAPAAAARALHDATTTPAAATATPTPTLSTPPISASPPFGSGTLPVSAAVSSATLPASAAVRTGTSPAPATAAASPAAPAAAAAAAATTAAPTAALGAPAAAANPALATTTGGNGASDLRPGIPHPRHPPTLPLPASAARQEPPKATAGDPRGTCSNTLRGGFGAAGGAVLGRTNSARAALGSTHEPRIDLPGVGPGMGLSNEQSWASLASTHESKVDLTGSAPGPGVSLSDEHSWASLTSTHEPMQKLSEQDATHQQSREGSHEMAAPEQGRMGTGQPRGAVPQVSQALHRPALQALGPLLGGRTAQQQQLQQKVGGATSDVSHLQPHHAPSLQHPGSQGFTLACHAIHQPVHDQQHTHQHAHQQQQELGWHRLMLHLTPGQQHAAQQQQLSFGGAADSSTATAPPTLTHPLPPPRDVADSCNMPPIPSPAFSHPPISAPGSAPGTDLWGEAAAGVDSAFGGGVSGEGDAADASRGPAPGAWQEEEGPAALEGSFAAWGAGTAGAACDSLSNLAAGRPGGPTAEEPAAGLAASGSGVLTADTAAAGLVAATSGASTADVPSGPEAEEAGTATATTDGSARTITDAAAVSPAYGAATATADAAASKGASPAAADEAGPRSHGLDSTPSLLLMSPSASGVLPPLSSTGHPMQHNTRSQGTEGSPGTPEYDAATVAAAAAAAQEEEGPRSFGLCDLSPQQPSTAEASRCSSMADLLDQQQQQQRQQEHLQQQQQLHLHQQAHVQQAQQQQQQRTQMDPAQDRHQHQALEQSAQQQRQKAWIDPVQGQHQHLALKQQVQQTPPEMSFTQVGHGPIHEPQGACESKLQPQLCSNSQQEHARQQDVEHNPETLQQQQQQLCETKVQQAEGASTPPRDPPQREQQLCETKVQQAEGASTTPQDPPQREQQLCEAEVRQAQGASTTPQDPPPRELQGQQEPEPLRTPPPSHQPPRPLHTQQRISPMSPAMQLMYALAASPRIPPTQPGTGHASSSGRGSSICEGLRSSASTDTLQCSPTHARKTGSYQTDACSSGPLPPSCCTPTLGSAAPAPGAAARTLPGTSLTTTAAATHGRDPPTGHAPQQAAQPLPSLSKPTSQHAQPCDHPARCTQHSHIVPHPPPLPPYRTETQPEAAAPSRQPQPQPSHLPPQSAQPPPSKLPPQSAQEQHTTAPPLMPASGAPSMHNSHTPLAPHPFAQHHHHNHHHQQQQQQQQQHALLLPPQQHQHHHHHHLRNHQRQHHQQQQQQRHHSTGQSIVGSPQAGLSGSSPQAGLSGSTPQAGLSGSSPQAGLSGSTPPMPIPGPATAADASPSATATPGLSSSQDSYSYVYSFKSPGAMRRSQEAERPGRGPACEPAMQDLSACSPWTSVTAAGRRIAGEVRARCSDMPGVGSPGVLTAGSPSVLVDAMPSGALSSDAMEEAASPADGDGAPCFRRQSSRWQDVEGLLPACSTGPGVLDRRQSSSSRWQETDLFEGLTPLPGSVGASGRRLSDSSRMNDPDEEWVAVDASAVPWSFTGGAQQPQLTLPTLASLPLHLHHHHHHHQQQQHQQQQQQQEQACSARHSHLLPQPHQPHSLQQPPQQYQHQHQPSPHLQPSSQFKGPASWRRRGACGISSCHNSGVEFSDPASHSQPASSCSGGGAANGIGFDAEAVIGVNGSFTDSSSTQPGSGEASIPCSWSTQVTHGAHMERAWSTHGAHSTYTDHTCVTQSTQGALPRHSPSPPSSCGFPPSGPASSLPSLSAAPQPPWYDQTMQNGSPLSSACAARCQPPCGVPASHGNPSATPLPPVGPSQPTSSPPTTSTAQPTSNLPAPFLSAPATAAAAPAGLLQPRVTHAASLPSASMQPVQPCNRATHTASLPSAPIQAGGPELQGGQQHRLGGADGFVQQEAQLQHQHHIPQQHRGNNVKGTSSFGFGHCSREAFNPDGRQCHAPAAATSSISGGQTSTGRRVGTGGLPKVPSQLSLQLASGGLTQRAPLP